MTKECKKDNQRRWKNNWKKDVDFEGIVIAGHTAGYDLDTFAIILQTGFDHIVIGARGIGLPKEIFFRSTSNFVLHKAKDPVTIVK